MLIAIEGIDGSGKGTQAKRLHERLLETGLRCALLSFPRYQETVFGRAIGDFLNGRFGSLDQVHPFLASLLYAGDRHESRPYLLQVLDENDVVVVDRYVPSNLAHQAAKRDGDERKELIRRIEQVEYEVFALPGADLVILLDLPVSAAQQLILMKRSRSYTNQKMDLHESDAGYLERVREVYLALAAERGAWERIECARGDQLRPVAEIAEEIWSRVERFRQA